MLLDERQVANVSRTRRECCEDDALRSEQDVKAM